MRDLKTFVWVIPFLGTFICLIALFTPAAYFENVIWNHEIVIWIWGYFQETFNSNVSTGFFTYPIQFAPSVIASVLIVLSISYIGIGLIRHRNELKNGYINIFEYLTPAILLISIIIFWMVAMENAEQAIYSISMWNRYTLSFGVIGLLVGACLTIIGSLLIKFTKTT